jgi:hypothetical protein
MSENVALILTENVALILTEISRPLCFSLFSAKAHPLELVDIAINREMNSLQDSLLEAVSSLTLTRLGIVQVENVT